MRVTVCELSDDPAAFEREWAGLVAHLKSASSDLVLLPEMPFGEWFAWNKTYDPGSWNELVRANDAFIASRLSELSPATVAATRAVNRGDRRLNVGFTWSSESGATERHVKAYLPDEDGVWEASWYHAGEPRYEVFDLGPARAGFLICTEMWFPEHARALGRSGAQIILSPRKTGSSTIEKWLVAGKADAVIGGCFALSANSRNSRHTDFGGGSWIVSPDGDLLGITSRDEPFVTVVVDPAEADRAKNTYPRYVGQP